MIYAREKHKVRLLTADRYFLKPVSRTFHGRDVFAPVAAHLAAGVAPARMGKRIDDYLRPSFAGPQRTGKRTWAGIVLRIDRFGNLVTNFHKDDFPQLDRRTVSMAIGPVEVTLLAGTYAECAPGELFLIAGSSGYLEVSMNQGSAASRIGCESGAPAELTVV
jgi:S-adenosylmethionine hydrolase